MTSFLRRSGGKANPRRDYRPLALLLIGVTIASAGYLVSLLPGRGVSSEASATSAGVGAAGFHDLKPFTPDPSSENKERDTEDPGLGPEEKADSQRRQETKRLLKEAGQAMQRGDLVQATNLVNQAGRANPDFPPAYYTMGRVKLAQQKFGEAQFFFERAIDLDPYYADAYFGHATASEGLGDLELALGGMRSFLHVAADADPFRLKIAQARSAIWEWEAQLGRGRWGATRGIPQGFTAEQLRRDGKGVAVRIEAAGPPAPDGSIPVEIKSADKFKLFQRP